MEEIEMVKMLAELFETRLNEIESIIDAINSIDTDYLWSVSDSDMDEAIHTLDLALHSVKKELRSRK